MSLQSRYAMSDRKKDGTLNLRIDKALKDAAMTAAQADRRSLTTLIEKLLEDYLREKGYLPAPPK